MSTAGEDSRAAREDNLRSAIIREVEDFREKYEPLTPEEVAWSHAVTEWLPRWRAWADGDPDGTDPPVPSLDTSAGAIATAAHVDVEVNGRDLNEKHWAWRRLWARTHGLIAAFASKQPNDTDDERAWVKRVEKDVRTLLAERFRELALANPGMRRVDDIDGLEMVRALYALGEYADGEDLDDEDLDDEDLDDENVSGSEQQPS